MSAANFLTTPFMGAGVRQDLHQLFLKFDNLNSFRVADFAQVFREMKFDTMLMNRQSAAEYVEFAEYLLHYASYYFRLKNEGFEYRKESERVFGVYTCYFLYNIQPPDHVCQIRITTEQVGELVTFEKKMVADGNLDVVACIHSLISKQAFQISMFQSTYDPCTHKKYTSEEENVDVNRGAVVPFERMTTILGSEIFNEMSYLHHAYVKGKRDLNISDAAICMIDRRNPVEEAHSILSRHKKELEVKKQNLVKIITDMVENDYEMPIEEDRIKESAGTSRSHLRSKAYSADLKHTRSRRYLDPKMDENFGHLTLGQLAQDILDEPSTSNPTEETTETETSPKKSPIKRRKRKVNVKEVEEPLDDHAMAEQVLQKSLAGMFATVKNESNDNPEALVGGKKTKKGTVAARVRAPKKKDVKIIEAEKKKPNQKAQKSTEQPENEVTKSPQKRGTVKKMQLPDEWSNKLKKMNATEKAAEKTLERLKNRIKMEDPADNLDL